MNFVKRISRRRQVGIAALLAASIAAVALPSAASAAAPAWSLSVSSYPTNFAPGSIAAGPGETSARAFPQYRITAVNVGGAESGGPITVSDTLPAGVSPSPSLRPESIALIRAGLHQESCSVAGQLVSCTYSGPIPQGEVLEVVIAVDVSNTEAVLTDEAQIEGGGAPEVRASTETAISADLAPFGVYDTSSSAVNADGAPVTQAGSHPYQFTFGFGLPSAIEKKGPETNPVADHPLRDLDLKFPPGFVINPNATTARCTEAQLEFFTSSSEADGSCPDAAQVGTISVATALVLGPSVQTNPMYNMVPPPGVAVELGFDVAGGVIGHVYGGVDSAGDYALTATSSDLLGKGGVPVLGVSTQLWGNPTDPAHEGSRYACLEGIIGVTSCPVPPVKTPLLTMPSACGPGPLDTSIGVDSWDEPGNFLQTAFPLEDPEGNPTGVNGCSALEFTPTISSQPTTNVADSPSGLNFNLHQPQNEDYEGLATAPLKDATVTLPAGMTINPSIANGLGACSEAQIGYQPKGGEIHFSEAPQSCPGDSKLGTVEVQTPLLKEGGSLRKLPGTIFLAKPYDNPFGTLNAIYLAIEDERSGVVSKLAGKVESDPNTGQLTTTFTENPQLPIEDFDLHFFNGPGAALKTPLTCGSHTTTSTLTPWSTPEGADAHPADSFATSVAASGSGACPSSEATAPKSVAFSAGTLTPQAGAYSPFALKVSRPDGSQRLSGIDTMLPKGLTGRLAGVPYCSEAQIAQARSREAPNQGALEQASSSCSAASEVGSVTVGAGAGATPFYTRGRAYLAGPYKGAPLSLVIITPAIAGPFDLGAVVVRTALYLDPESAQIHAVSDPLPSIIDGIPLDLRSIALRLDRPQFTLNPTNCEPAQISGAAALLGGQSSPLASPFQVGGCKGLGFKPKLQLRLKGSTKRAGHPALIATVTYPSKGSYANIASAQVALPHSEFLDQGHIGTVCTRVQFAQKQCPPASVYGSATATTPLLGAPLSGPVYLRSSSHELPDLVADLNGQVEVVLDGRVDSINGGIRTTFEAVPDQPVSRFTLRMRGQKKGLLQNSTNLCAKPNRANVRFGAQNGKQLEQRPLLKVKCAPAKKRRHRASSHRGR